MPLDADSATLTPEIDGVRAIRNFDWLFFGTMLAMTLVGIAFIWSSTHWLPNATFAGQQLRWLGLSLLVLLVLLAFDYQHLTSVAYVAYALMVIALVLVLVPGIGVVRNEARRWISFPGFMVQPSEFAKIVVVLALARYLMYRKSCRRATGLVAPLLIVLAPMALILKEPDLGTALVLLPALLAMLYAAGAARKHLWGLIGAGLALAPLVYFFIMKDGQRRRVTAFLWPELDPDGGWHLRQSLAAVASGGVTGEGFSSGSPVVLNRGFAAHTDFIYAVISHEWGFLGAVAVLLLVFLFFSRGLEIAGETREPFGRLIAVGFLSMLAFQALVNISMTLRLCPITGITLPFVSYGGSSLLVCFVMAALVLNVGMRRKPVVATDDFR